MKLVLKKNKNAKWIGILTWHRQVWYTSKEYDTKEEAKQDALYFGKEVSHWWK